MKTIYLPGRGGATAGALGVHFILSSSVLNDRSIAEIFRPEDAPQLQKSPIAH